MGGWSNATHQGWHQVRRDDAARLPCAAGRWTVTDVAIMIGTGVFIHWEVCVAFLALKLWQQASGYEGSVFAFAVEKWEALVGATRSLMAGVRVPSGGLGFGARSSGNKAFDAWRQGELARIDAERGKLRAAEREFTAYRDELLHAKDREDFERFMNARRDGFEPARG